MSEPFIVYHPCVTYVEGDHTSLLDWVRDENDFDTHKPIERNSNQTAQIFWEAEGRIFMCPGNAVFAANGNPDKVRRCYLIIDGRLRHDECHYPPNWLDRERTHA